MVETLTLREAGGRLGVDGSVLKRLIRTGGLPEAEKVRRERGSMWVIPVDQLGPIAARNEWTIDLRDEEPAVYPEPSRATSPSGGTTLIASPEELEAKPNPVVVEPTTAESAAVGNDQRRADELAVAEVIDAALLDRLLGAHEQKAEAIIRSQDAERAAVKLQSEQKQTEELLGVERRERGLAIDRFRQEQTARFIADAKVAELRDRLVREMSSADAEKQARTDAVRRSLAAERDAANAVASMGWVSRRRYRRISGSGD